MTLRRLITAALAALMSLAMVFGASLSASATPVLVTTITAPAYSAYVALSPDGTRLYAISFSPNALNIIDTADNQLLSTTPLSQLSNPQGLVVSVDGSKLYILDAPVSQPSQIDIVSLAGGTPTYSSTITVGRTSTALTMSPDGSKLYVASGYDNKVSVISTSSNAVEVTIDPPAAISGTLDYPRGLVVSPDGTKLYVSYYNDSGTNSGLASFNTANNGLLNSIEFASTVHPWGVDISPNGRYLYVANYGNLTSPVTDSSILTFDLQTQANFTSSVSTVTVNNGARALSVSADGSVLYLAVGSSAKVYNTSDMTQVTTLNLPGSGNVNFSVEASNNAASHFSYVGGTGSLNLIGEYLSLFRQAISGNLGVNLSSAALTASGISGTVTYSVAPALPAGFTLNSSTGVVSGSSSTSLSAATYTITGTNGTTSAVATVSITVTDPSTPSGGGSSNQLANTGKKSQLPIALIGLMFLFAGISVYSGSVALKRKAD